MRHKLPPDLAAECHERMSHLVHISENCRAENMILRMKNADFVPLLSGRSKKHQTFAVLPVALGTPGALCCARPAPSCGGVSARRGFFGSPCPAAGAAGSTRKARTWPEGAVYSTRTFATTCLFCQVSAVTFEKGGPKDHVAVYVVLEAPLSLGRR